MTVFNFKLAGVLPNPFQTRKSEDPQHIQNLAASIKERGLLQIPSARISPIAQTNVELVFGHSRLAAFQLLTDTGNTGFESIPLNIVEMSDEQMFQAAVSENLDRKDLSPIEEALAMQTYMDEFHKTSEEVGQLFHLSDSAVRGKLRLLKLPDEIKELVGKKITEGAAREVITFLDLPEEIIDVKPSYERETLRERIIRKCQEGASAESMAEENSRVVFMKGKKLDKKYWKSTEELSGTGIVGLCKGCAFLQKRDGGDYCLKISCYEAKENAWKQRYLEQASLLSGFPIFVGDHNSYISHTDFKYGKEAKLQTIRAGRCENLRIKFTDSTSYPNKSVCVDGFAHAEIICCKREMNCTCLKALNAGIEISDGSDASLAEERLKEINRQVREQKRIDNEFIVYLKNQTAVKVIESLGKNKVETWIKCLTNLGTYGMKFENAISMSEIYNMVTRKHFEYLGDDKNSVLKSLNKFLVDCGLEELDIVLEQPEKPAGKTLAEVFEEESVE